MPLLNVIGQLRQNCNRYIKRLLRPRPHLHIKVMGALLMIVNKGCRGLEHSPKNALNLNMMHCMFSILHFQFRACKNTVVAHFKIVTGIKTLTFSLYSGFN